MIATGKDVDGNVLIPFRKKMTKKDMWAELEELFKKHRKTEGISGLIGAKNLQWSGVLQKSETAARISNRLFGIPLRLKVSPLEITEEEEQVFSRDEKFEV
eukprot:COSAG02_NODE_23275_length_723_cov_340.469551_1_plen_101_part_00